MWIVCWFTLSANTYLFLKKKDKKKKKKKKCRLLQILLGKGEAERISAILVQGR